MAKSGGGCGAGMGRGCLGEKADIYAGRGPRKGRLAPQNESAEAGCVLAQRHRDQGFKFEFETVCMGLCGLAASAAQRPAGVCMGHGVVWPRAAHQAPEVQLRACIRGGSNMNCNTNNSRNSNGPTAGAAVALQHRDWVRGGPRVVRAPWVCLTGRQYTQYMCPGKGYALRLRPLPSYSGAAPWGGCTWGMGSNGAPAHTHDTGGKQSVPCMLGKEGALRIRAELLTGQRQWGNKGLTRGDPTATSRSSAARLAASGLVRNVHQGRWQTVGTRAAVRHVARGHVMLTLCSLPLNQVWGSQGAHEAPLCCPGPPHALVTWGLCQPLGEAGAQKRRDA